MFTPDELAILEPLIRAEIDLLRNERDAYGDPDMDPNAPTRVKRMRIMDGASIPQVRAHRLRLQSMIDVRKSMLDRIEAAQENSDSNAEAA